MARDRVLAELAALGPAPADAGRPGGVDAAGLLGQVRDLAVFADQVTGELARLAGALDACGGVAEAGIRPRRDFCGMGAAGRRGGPGAGGGGAGAAAAGPRQPAGSLLREQAWRDDGAAGAAPGPDRFGAMLTARQVLALACHAELSIIRWSDGIPLDAGRRYRTETPAIRRALEARDQGCRAPGCSMPAAWCTAHHLKPWSQGGTTSLQDTALFCFVHHNYFIHLLGWTITGDPNGTLHFTHPQGWPTLDSPLPSAAKPRPP